MVDHELQMEILTKVSQQELSVEEAVRLLGQSNAAAAPVESWSDTPRTETFNEALNGAESASLSLSTHAYPVEIYPLKESPNLVEAVLEHRGKVSWQVEGGAHRRIVQNYREKHGWHFFSTASLRWRYGLSPLVPMALDVDSGSGSMRMDLAGLQLTRLNIDSGSGSVKLILPSTTAVYEVSIDSGSGSIRIDIPEQTNVKVLIRSGSGSVKVRLPKDCEFRAALKEHGSGSFNVPAQAVRVFGNHREGAWQTPGYDQAENRVEVVVEQGSGSFSLHNNQG
jgi:hypothetical protein